MTVEQLVELVEKFNYAVRQSHDWMSPGGTCCGRSRPHGYCINPSCASRVDYYAAYHARDAAHFAGQLQLLVDRWEAGSELLHGSEY